MIKLITVIFITTIILNSCFVFGKENIPTAEEEDSSIDVLYKLNNQYNQVSETNNFNASITAVNRQSLQW